MLKLLSMQVRGFCSIPSLKVEFDQKQTLLIKGANGNGKSTLLSALVWCLYGKSIKGTSVQTWKKYRTKEYLGTMVQVFFQVPDSVYSVIRCSNYNGDLFDGSKGKDRFILLKDGYPLDIKGKQLLQQKLNEILGFTQKSFTNSIMFGQGLDRMLRESNSDKKKLLEEIFDLTYLNTAKTLAMDGKNKISQDYRSLSIELEHYSRELDTISRTYKDLREKERDFSKCIKSEIDELLEDKSKLSKKKEEVQKEIGKSYKYQIDKLNEDIHNLYNNLKEAKSVSNIPIKEFIDKVYGLMRDHQYNKALKHLSKLKEAFDTIDDIDNKLEVKNAKLRELKDKQYQYDKYSRILSDIESDLEYIEHQLSKLRKEKPKILSSKYKKQIREVKEKIYELKDKSKVYEEDLGNYTWLINDPLGNNGIKAYLFDSNLEFLNRELERYSSILGFHISFEIDLSSSRKDFYTLIEKDNQIIDYDELSGGEKQLVDVSMAFALNQTLTLSKGINIAFLDELFESLSDDNIELVTQLVKEVYQDKTLFIISHHSNLPFSKAKIIEVEKLNGLSYYRGL